MIITRKQLEDTEKVVSDKRATKGLWYPESEMPAMAETIRVQQVGELSMQTGEAERMKTE
jgi:hypothetical protein